MKSRSDPWFGDMPLTGGIQLSQHRAGARCLHSEGRGGGVLRQPISWPDYTRGLISYDLRNVTLSHFAPVQPGEASNLTALRATDWPRLVSSVTLSFTRTSTDNPFYASRGSRTSWSNTFAGGPLGGVEEFYRSTFEVKNYSRLQGPFVLMLRGRTGFIGGSSVPDYERSGRRTTVDYLRATPTTPSSTDQHHRDPVTGVVTSAPGGRSAHRRGRVQSRSGAAPRPPLLRPGGTWNSTRDRPGTFAAPPASASDSVPALGRILDLGYGLDREEGPGWRSHFQLGNTL
jgi:hypothetical protein